MDRFTRILSLHKILASRRTPVPRRELEERLESNRSTVKRTIEEMRDFLDAPIVYDRAANGYYYDQKHSEHPWQIPGLWFNSKELYALLAAQKLLDDIQPGLLDDSIQAFKQRIEQLLQGMGNDSDEVVRRVRVLPMEARDVHAEDFRKLTTALMQRRQIKVAYHGRERDETVERMVSPQRLIYYRDNWYLDGWCHLRRGLRTFSLDRLKPIAVSSESALEFSDKKMDKHFTRTFGIFAGPAEETAQLRFSPVAARWVADTRWHPQQQGETLADGGYMLKVPYGNPTELLREIMKHGPEVEVLAPESLRQQLLQRLNQTRARYGD